MRGRPMLWASVEGTESIALDVNQLSRGGCLGRHGASRCGRLSAGEVLNVAFVANHSVPHGITLTLSGIAATHVDGEFSIEQKIQLTRVRAGFGGYRWYFLCPRSGRRVAKLYLPNGARIFASRQSYRMIYASQQEDALGRAQRAALRVWRRLGGDPHDWVPDAEPPLKPKWMRWKTYDQLVERLERAEARSEATWTIGAIKLLRRAHRFA